MVSAGGASSSISMTSRGSMGRQTSAKATLELLLGGWSGAAISSTTLSVADFSPVSRGSLRSLGSNVPAPLLMPKQQCNSAARLAPAPPAGGAERSAAALQWRAMSEPAPTVFDKILAGEIPCYRVYEDPHVLAFLDIGPLSAGHTLVIPKERKAYLHELSDESAAALGRVLPRLCRAVLRATGATDYNVLQNNGRQAHQVVMHVHFHIIPKSGQAGLGILWPAGGLEAAAAADLVARLRRALEAEEEP